MKLSIITPKKALKSLLKQKPLRSEIDIFKTNLIRLLEKVNEIEREENQKNHIRDFLRDSFYKDTNEINTKDSKDLVIHLGKTNKDKVGVIIEAKRPSNKSEMLSAEKPNTKALQELVLYYLRERIEENNIDIKYCIATNIYQWYLIEASYFENIFARNKPFIKEYEQWRDKQKVTSDTKLFYESIAKPFIDKIQDEIPCIYFDIRDYETVLRNDKKDDDKELIALFKILSPQYLLKTVTPNDSNSLNEKFYKELLHVIGLEEAKEGNKNIIRQKIADKSNASFIEMAIKKLRTKGIHKVNDKKKFGETTDEQNFNIALELCITWINRILFLKLLEGQLLNYHKGNKDYCFLNIKTIHDFDELFTLFHSVLAVNVKDREPNIQQKYKLVPYLNSSLFEISELEDVTISIDNLDNSETLQFNSSSILKDTKSKNTGLNTLEYLFKFLDAYDFASEGAEDVQEENKTIINASVLGKVFEKINGYKDGSIYTPAFITMYMCKQSIRLSVVEKFNETKGWNVKEFAELYNKIEDKKVANQIINSIKICDPAVGSGHFLVSALNELISIKSELNVLIDENGKTLRDYEIEIINDELIITDENNNIVAYNPQNKESNRVQKTLFHEKQTIIENCLFGVDINPNSVKICRLRLWIELLKNAYYKAETNYTELETLPNIDINIKCGNSLLSRFTLDADLSKALKSIKYDIEAYRGFVNDYKNEKNRDAKRGLQLIIDTIKADFRTEISKNDPKQMRLNKLSGELFTLLNQGQIFEQSSKEKKLQKEKQQKLETDIEKYAKEIDEIKTNAIYKNAFEWRFEFPEVLNNKGDFEGFDLVIGNPPYFSLAGIKDIQKYFTTNYKTFLKGVDIYCLFLELAKNISSKNAQTILIISNKWRTASYGLKTRNFLANSVSDLTIVDFDKFQIFDGVSVDSGIISYTNNLVENGNLKFKVKDKNQDVNDFLVPNQQQETLKLINNDNWNLLGSKYDFIKQKIEDNNNLINTFGLSLNRGITTGFNDAFIINQNTKTTILKQNPRAISLIKPLLRGRDIKKYTKEESNLWIIYIPKGFTIKNSLPSISTLNSVSEPPPRYGNMPIDEAAEWFKNNYFSIWSHLVKFKNQLINRIDKGDYWWELRACSYLENFEKDKIIFTKASKIQAFTFDVDKNYLLNTSYFFTGDNLKYFLAILNSKLISFSFLNFYQGGGIEGEITIQALEKIPIPAVNKIIENKFTALVDKILTAKQIGNETTAFEKQIDSLVYNLYNLTTDEITIVEQLQ